MRLNQDQFEASEGNGPAELHCSACGRHVPDPMPDCRLSRQSETLEPPSAEALLEMNISTFVDSALLSGPVEESQSAAPAPFALLEDSAPINAGSNQFSAEPTEQVNNGQSDDPLLFLAEVATSRAQTPSSEAFTLTSAQPSANYVVIQPESLLYPDHAPVVLDTSQWHSLQPQNLNESVAIELNSTGSFPTELLARVRAHYSVS